METKNQLFFKKYWKNIEINLKKICQKQEYPKENWKRKINKKTILMISPRVLMVLVKGRLCHFQRGARLQKIDINKGVEA